MAKGKEAMGDIGIPTNSAGVCHLGGLLGMSDVDRDSYIDTNTKGV